LGSAVLKLWESFFNRGVATLERVEFGIRHDRGVGLVIGAIGLVQKAGEAVQFGLRLGLGQSVDRTIPFHAPHPRFSPVIGEARGEVQPTKAGARAPAALVDETLPGRAVGRVPATGERGGLRCFVGNSAETERRTRVGLA
jgi:hypothetical protein